VDASREELKWPATQHKVERFKWVHACC